MEIHYVAEHGLGTLASLYCTAIATWFASVGKHLHAGLAHWQRHFLNGDASSALMLCMRRPQERRLLVAWCILSDF